MIAEIKAFLQNKGSWDMGNALLAKLHEQGACTAFVVRLCKGGRSEFSSRKMNEELARVLSLMESGSIPVLAKTMVPKELPKKKSFEPAPTLDKAVDWTKLPDDIRPLDQEIKSLYSHNKTIRGQLRELAYTPDGKVRGDRSMKRNAKRLSELCFLAVNNQEKINAMWARVDYYRTHNMHKPGTQPQEVMAQIKDWLRMQPQMVNYTRQEDHYFKKNGKHRNSARYNEYKSALQAIKEYVEGVQ